jgi:transcription initiation factor TFIIIB Brf1 subunit/transcription initiation factor TFIIB
VFEHSIEISMETSSGFANPDEKRNTFSTSGTIDQLLPQSSMSSYLVGKGHNSVKRLQMWGRVPTKERSLLLVFERIKQALQRSTIDSKVLNDSKIIYHNLYMRSQTEFNKKNVLSRGLNRDGLIAYIVFIACEENSILVNKTSICELFNITETVFKAGKRKYHDLMIKKETTSSTVRYTLTDYMGRFLAMLPFTPEERKMCFVVTKRIEQIKLMKNKQPVSAAAGLIYFMVQFYNKEDITRQYISKISEKSEPTILKIATVLNEYKFYILPKHLL